MELEFKRDTGKEEYSNEFPDHIWWHNILQIDGQSANIMLRGGGSVSLYFTHPYNCHAVIYDTIGMATPNPTALAVIDRLKEMKEGIEVLLATLPQEVERNDGPSLRDNVVDEMENVQ
jgi:hypothetical protein